MKSSDVFRSATKRNLADRAGHHCSLCLALTTCSDAEGKPFPIGDAAHQAAASPGGPRYDSKQTKRQRSSADNGLWLCSSCHRKIDGDKFRYSVDDLKQMKEEAEERARRMVHGDIVFEMKNKEQAAIEHYLSLRPMVNKLPKSGFGTDAAKVPTGAKLGIQVVPHIAITDRPKLAHAELVELGVASSQGIVQAEKTDSKGAIISRGSEISRLDRDATSETWINYPKQPDPDFQKKTLPGPGIARDIVLYIRNVREVIKRHKIRNDKLIVRGRLENAMEKIVQHSQGTGGVQVNQPIVETGDVILDVGEEIKFLEEFWYCLGCAGGLPGPIADYVKKDLTQSAFTPPS